MTDSLSRSFAFAGGLLLAIAMWSCRQDPVERGRHLVAVAACMDCHTPFVPGPNGPEPDMTRFLSGHPQDAEFEFPELPDDGAWWVGSSLNTAYAGPWGVSYAANLTPDENTGLGIWTEEMFVRALKTGRHMGTSRVIQPPMPWPAYSKLPEEDLVAIYRYLRTLPPVHNRVKESMNADELLASLKSKGRRS